jgi:DNA primase catalytic core
MKESDFKDLVETVRERTDIVEVIGQRISLNGQKKAFCPFHKEEVPSFSVHAEKKYFHCFGCGAHGDVFNFLQLNDGMSFMEALAYCAEKAEIPIPTLTEEAKQRMKEQREVEDVLAKSARFYRRNLTPELKAYFVKQRGLHEETIEDFQIGFARGGLWQHLIEECRFSEELCIRAGVLKRKNGETRDYFYQRFVFPNMKRGRVVHLSSRGLDGHEPKYLHLTGRIDYLYNEDALSSKEVIVTEGVLDCLSAVQADFPAVATLGTTGLEHRCEGKFSRCETVYLCFDGDEAGREAALKLGELIGEQARVVELPEGTDLNDYLRGHTRDDFQALVASAKDTIEYEVSLTPKDTPKIRLPDRLKPVLKKLGCMDKARAEAYLSYEVKERFGLRHEDIDGYRDIVNGYRRESQEGPNVNTSRREAQRKYTADLDGLVDLVEHEGNPAFLVKDGDNLSVLPEVERDGFIYVPPAAEQIPWLLPRSEEVQRYFQMGKALPNGSSDGPLFEDLLAWHMEISELPGEDFYVLLAAWDFHTYFNEFFQYSPIICLFAVPERGKSRTGKGMIHVAHRGIHVESLREAYLVRVANDLNASLFFDVKDIWRKAEKSGSDDILLHRFEKGPMVARVLYPDRGAHEDIVYYSLYGPTIISTNEGVHKILDTRSIAINMPETTANFENEVTAEEALKYKERLVACRARNMDRPMPELQKPAKGRLGDILKPLHQIIRLVKPEREQQFLRLAEQLKSQRLVEKATSLEAQILRVVLDLRDRVENGILTVKAITDTFNEDKHEKSKITYQRVGRRLSAMGFQKVTASGGTSAIVWDEEKMEQLRESYGLHATPEPPETPDGQPDNAGDSGDSGVSRRLL